MESKPRWLQVCTLVFFASMLAGFVLYRSGFFRSPGRPMVEVLGLGVDSLPPVWFDSVLFQKLTKDSGWDGFMYGSKSGRIFKTSFFVSDSTSALQFMEDYYQLRNLSSAELTEFEKELRFVEILRDGDNSGLPLRKNPSFPNWTTEDLRLETDQLFPNWTSEGLRDSLTALHLTK